MRFFCFMNIKVNGESFETAGDGTVSDLLRELKVDAARVAAVEVNLSIVKRADFAAFLLKDGDQVEIVNFVGGG